MRGLLFKLLRYRPQTLYLQPSEIIHAWHWVKMARTDESLPTRVMYHGKGLFHNYTPEYIGI